jgi:hypothetical protein
MPKDTPPSLPLSGLFAVAKPSGPTSMAIINDVKDLINTSSLFVEQAKLAGHKEGKNEKPKRRRGRAIKIWPRLVREGRWIRWLVSSPNPISRSCFPDPTTSDGVLGNPGFNEVLPHLSDCYSSRWDRKRN